MSSCREYLLHGGGQLSAGGEQLHLHGHVYRSCVKVSNTPTTDEDSDG